MSNIKQAEIARIAGEAGAKIVFEMLEKEKKKASKERRDRRLRNTKLLMRNYRMLSAHSDGAIYASKQIGKENAIDILDMLESALDDEDFYVESIKRSAERTRIIMNHVDEMIRFYRNYCFASGRQEDLRRYNVLCAMYLSDCVQSAKEIAEKENIDKRTVYKDVDAATEKLSALLFGIDGLKY